MSKYLGSYISCLNYPRYYLRGNLSYSFHVGNDKNKTSKAKKITKERPTNFNNNAIEIGIQLSKVNHHNLRIYDIPIKKHFKEDKKINDDFDIEM